MITVLLLLLLALQTLGFVLVLDTVFKQGVKYGCLATMGEIQHQLRASAVQELTGKAPTKAAAKN